MNDFGEPLVPPLVKTHYLNSGRQGSSAPRYEKHQSLVAVRVIVFISSQCSADLIEEHNLPCKTTRSSPTILGETYTLTVSIWVGVTHPTSQLHPHYTTYLSIPITVRFFSILTLLPGYLSSEGYSVIEKDFGFGEGFVVRVCGLCVCVWLVEEDGAVLRLHYG